ncbi:MAG: DNA gyrase subunit A [Bacillota bacterium]
MVENNLGKTVPVNIEDEMKKSYIDYAMSVIVGRALPDVRDGLKPVHRRILYAMHEAGMGPDKPHKKSARVVGDVMARFHPHGDSAIYDAMVRMAQDFSTRYRLVDGHGNFGSVDGDSAAAMRYTEARLSKISMELLADIDKETVDFVPNYDETQKEPVFLPSRFPNLLVNGSSGIAVGMATNIPPHNLSEVINGLVRLIDEPESDIKELMLSIKGPDFPTGGTIMGREGIKSAYLTGRGAIKVRAKTEIEVAAGGKVSIIVTELPYQVNKAKLVEKIAALVRDKKIEGITDLRDESDRTGMRVAIELRRDINPQVMLNQLYKHTQMQETFGVIMLALVNGVPKVLNLREVLVHYLDHQKQVIRRRTRYLLDKAEARAHIIEGLRIAINNLDAVIKTIRESQNVDTARERLMQRFELSEKQAQAILEMRLSRLTALEREKLEAEYRELIKTIAYLTEVLGNERMVMNIIKEEIQAIKDKFGDPRRSQISAIDENLDIEDLIAEEDMVLTVTHRGYVKRIPLDTYRSQRRGGRGVTGLTTREEDFVEHLFITTTHHYLLFFTNKGKVYRLKVYEIPEAGRQAKGTAVVNLLSLNQGDVINAIIPIREFTEEKYLFMATKNGVVKKTHLQEYDTSRKDGIIALNLDESDELIGVRLTSGQEDVILGTANCMAILFNEKEVRSMGRTAHGVRGISLGNKDKVVSMDCICAGKDLMVVTERGFGKRSPFTDYRSQTRGGKGIITIRKTSRSGALVDIKAVDDHDELMIISGEGIIIRMAIKDVPTMGRLTQGVTLMRMEKGDRVVAVAKVQYKEDEE